MDRDHLFAYLEQQVSERDELNASTGDAFAHVAVREYFDLDDEEALEYCDVGGSHDKGIDAVWIEDGQRMVVVQTKWTADPTNTFAKKAVQETESAVRWLERLAAGGSGLAAPRVIDAARQLYELREADPAFPISLYVVVAGKFTRGAREEAERVADDLDDRHARIDLIDIDDLLGEVERRLDRDGGVDTSIPPVTLTLAAGEYFEHDADPRALVATVKGHELARAAEKHGFRLFMRNVRFLLPGKAKGSVNAGIQATLRSPEGRERFWYYNNGIAMVCSSYELDEVAGTAVVHDLQIVNGAQTTANLSAALESLRGEPEVTLLARIIEAAEEELQQNVTFYNNRQNAVKDRDLQSNDPIQDRLQREFRDLPEPWFYERKRGEWAALSARDAELKQQVGKRRIDNERSAQAAYAFYFDPARARADKKSLFLTVKDGGYYDRVFNESRTAVSLLVPFLFAEHIRLRKNDYLKRLKAIDAQRPTNDDKRALALQWVKFADQFILGAFAFYLDRRGGHSDARLKHLLAADFESITSGLYATSIRDLSPLFSRKVKQARDAGRVFSPANFVKANWEEVHQHLFGEWEARDAVGDPLDGIPVLSEH